MPFFSYVTEWKRLLQLDDHFVQRDSFSIEPTSKKSQDLFPTLANQSGEGKGYNKPILPIFQKLMITCHS